MTRVHWRCRHLVALLAVVAATPLLGQNNRSAVSVTGNDAAACTVPDPCRTFDVTISKTNPGGEIVALSSGGYGSLTITKSIAILAAPGVHAAITAAAGNAITVAASQTEDGAPRDFVVLRGLYLNSLGGTNGIHFQSGVRLHVEESVISGFLGGAGIRFTSSGFIRNQLFVIDSVIRENGDGIYVTGTAGQVAAQVTITRTVLASNHNGLNAAAFSRVAISDSTVAGNRSAGFYLNVTGGFADVTLTNCVAANSWGGDGLAAVGAGANAYVKDSTLTNNGNGIFVASGAVVRVIRSAITENANGLRVWDTGSILSGGDNMVEGNGSGETFTGNFLPK